MDLCADDSICEYQCYIDFVECANVCPCQPGCPLGCIDCESSYCKCRDPENSPEYLECKEPIISLYSPVLNVETMFFDDISISRTNSNGTYRHKN